MFDHGQLFTAALQLKDPLYVKEVKFMKDAEELHLYIDFNKGGKFACPICNKENLKVHDTKNKTWRHLNFFQYKAFIHFRTPRVECAEHGVHLIDIPWAKPGIGFTILFEAFVIQLAMVMPMSQISKLLNEHDTRLWRILERYVNEARKEADYSNVTKVGVDETSSRKGHKYVTLFVDSDESRVIHVAKGKDSKTITSFKEMLTEREINPEQITDFSADMSIPFKKGISTEFPTAAVTYDKFHVIKLMNEALDKVRRNEQKEEEVLKYSRYVWLKNQANLTVKQNEKLTTLSEMNLRTARAYRIKLALQDVYKEAMNKMHAEVLLKKWYAWAIRSRIEAVRDFAKTVKNNWEGILNHFNSRLTNAVLESINSIVQSARNRAKGYRNVDTFITMIYLLGGKLELEGVS